MVLRFALLVSTPPLRVVEPAVKPIILKYCGHENRSDFVLNIETMMLNSLSGVLLKISC